MNFLSRLLDFVFPPRSHEEIVRTLSPEMLSGLLVPTLIETTRPATIGLLPFQHASVRALVHEAKYHASTKAQELLGGVLAEYLADVGSDTFRNIVLVPLPLSPARLRERGFNQCERVAERALHSLNNPSLTLSTTLLVRTKNTEHQARLSRPDRLKNVQGAFAVRGALDPAVSYLILDDVITTGATLQAALDALSAAGARHLIPIALCR